MFLSRLLGRARSTTRNNTAEARKASRRKFFSNSNSVSRPRALRMESLEDRALMATFHVALTGLDTNPGTIAQPFRTIQVAVNAASATSDGQDIINVAGGTYNAPGIDQRFDISGSANLDNLQLLGGWNAAFTTRNPAATPTNYTFTNSPAANRYDIQALDAGTTINGFTLNSSDGVVVRDADTILVGETNVTVSNNVINVGIRPGGGTRPSGVVTSSADTTGLQILNNTIDVNFAGAVGSPTAAIGIFLNPSPATSALIDGNVISGNNMNSGVIVSGSNNVTIQNNTFNRNSPVFGGSIELRNNIASVNNAMILNNTINDTNATPANAAAGIVIGGSGGLNAPVTSSTIRGNAISALGSAAQGIIARAGTVPGSTLIELNSLTGVAPGSAVLSLVPGLDVSGNWFGSASAAAVDAAISATGGGTIIARSYLSSGADANASAPGLQLPAATEMLVPQTAATSGLAEVDGRIQSGIDRAAIGMTVRTAADTYKEDIVVNKTVVLVGAGPALTTIEGPKGNGIGTTVQIVANNVDLSNFRITREGNNVADWYGANGALNLAGVAIQEQATTGAVIHDNDFFGNRSGIDINNSNGHTIRNNVVSQNRTGLIFRNQTDNMTIVENTITDNFTVGFVFLDGSGGSNSPVQTAANWTSKSNNISGNWYGQIVDRQTGGSLPAPGTNLKNFSGNWFGTTTPVVTTANSAEPGYGVAGDGLSRIPTAFGGTQTSPAPGTQPDIAGPASANFDFTPLLASGTDTNVETTPGRGTFGFQGDFSTVIVTTQGAQTGAVGRINEGIAAATDNGTVKILDGTYAEIVDATAPGENVNLSPGASPGQVVVGGLLLNAGDTLTIEIDGFSPVAPTEFDNFIVNGDVALNGADLVVISSIFPVGGSFQIITNNGPNPVGGMFLDGTSIIISGVPFTINYMGGNGNDVVLQAVTPIVTYAEDTAWDLLAPGTMVDGDLTTVAIEPAILGYDAFNSPGVGVNAIQNAINSVVDGGITIVNPGVYEGDVNINKNLLLQGPQDGVNPNDALWNDTRSNLANEAVIHGATNLSLRNVITVDGFTFERTAANEGHILIGAGQPSGVAATSEFDILNNRFVGSRSTGTSWAGIHTNFLNDVTLPGAQFLAHQNRITIAGTASGSGILVNNNTPGTDGLGVTTITDTYVASSPGNGFNVNRPGGSALIDGNRVVNDDIFTFRANNTIISNNEISDAPQAAISNTGGSTNWTATNNTITTPRAQAFRVGSIFTADPISNVTITNNTVTVDPALVGVGLLTPFTPLQFAYVDIAGSLTGTNLVSENSVTFGGNALNPAVIAVYGVRVRGTAGSGGVGNLSVTKNDFDANGVGGAGNAAFPPSSGIFIDTDLLTSSLDFDAQNNFINGWVNGATIYDTNGGVAGAFGNLPIGAIVELFNNDLSGNSGLGVQSGPGEITDASGNWWGTNTLAGIQAEVTANVDFTPWLNVGADTDAGTPGFQGDFSVLNVDDDSPQAGTTGRITEAYDDLTPTGTINVFAGTYVENVDLGAGPDKAVFFSPGGHTPTNPDQVTITGNLTLTANDSLRVELNGPNATTDYDNLVVNGTVALGGATLVATAGVTYSDFDIITLISNDLADPTVPGFAGIADGTIVTISGQQFYVFYNGSNVVNTAGNDVILVKAPGAAPTITYAEDTAWNAFPNGTLVDGDLSTAGVQNAILGINAFGPLTNPPATPGAIQKAINAANGTAMGVRVIVNEGTYPENVLIMKNLTLEGRPDGGPSNSSITGGGIGVTIVGATQVVLRDINIASGGAALDVNMSTNSTLMLDRISTTTPGTINTVGTVNFRTDDNANTVDVTGSTLAANNVSTITYAGVTNLTINTMGGNDVINATPAPLAGGANISIFGGTPPAVPNPVPMGDTVGDVLNLNLTGIGGPVVVATVSGNVFSPTTKPLTFAEIEDININDGGMTNVVMGDLYARGTSGPDTFQVSLNATPVAGQPTKVRLRANTAFYTVSMTTKAVIYGREGNDTISMVNVALPAEFYGEGNDDNLTGYTANDLLVGGTGLDRVQGGAGNNTLYGDNATGEETGLDGNDIVTGGVGNDTLYGGGGNDTMSGAGGSDYLYGGGGNDSMDGGEGSDRLYGGNGNDTLGGAGGDDLLAGNAGDDKLYGKAGNDVVIGGDGADLVMGEDGNDLLFNGMITYNSPAPPVVGTDASTTANDTNDQAMLALLNAWSAGTLMTSNVSRVHDAFVDTLGGGTGTDTAHAKPAAPAKDLGDWEILLT